MGAGWLILADDLTGAADSAIAFARRRLTTRVVWADARPDAHADAIVLSLDLATRALAAPVAARRHVEALHRCLDGRSRVYKKIDSTLRGNPAAEIAAMLDVLSSRGIVNAAAFAPAFPAGGRTTRAARVYVHGVPLEFTEFWPEGRDAADAHLLSLLESAGLRAHPVPLDVVRGDAATLARAMRPSGRTDVMSIAVCDAETEGDLDRVAAAASLHSAFCIGSGGFVHSLATLASRDAATRSPPPRNEPATNGALIVVGSQASVSRAALMELARLPHIRHATATHLEHGATLLDRTLVGELTRALDAGEDVVVDLGPPEDPESLTLTAVSALARELAPLAAHASALAATGGDTAAALCSHCGVTGIALIDEIEPGMSLGLTLGTVSMPIVTKSGGFGDRGSLVRLAERLRFIRSSGTVA